MPRILPFALFTAFVALESVIRWSSGLVPLSESYRTLLSLWFYPLRTGVVLGTLVYLWPAYQELQDKVWGGWREALLVVVVGVLVYLVWVHTDWPPWAVQGTPTGYNPFQAGAGIGIVLAAVRILGAAAVVPIIEELFWRSFLLRYLVISPFSSVRLGTFTPFSFGATVVLFGLEHHFWLAGMIAGAVYNLLLYKTRRLWPCILAHGITNLALGIHVLATNEWYWW
jgi:hypothetical protein